MSKQRAEFNAAPIPKVAALFIALTVKPGTRAQQSDGLVREEAVAMLTG